MVGGFAGRQGGGLTGRRVAGLRVAGRWVGEEGVFGLTSRQEVGIGLCDRCQRVSVGSECRE